MNLTDSLFHAYREVYKLNEDEFDYIIENCTDDELDILILSSKPTFKEIKSGLKIVKKYLGIMSKQEK